MDDKRLNVRNVCEKREYLKPVNERLSLFCAALDLKRKDGRAPVGEVLFVQRMVGMIGQWWR